jgi:hypothetical protein
MIRTNLRAVVVIMASIPCVSGMLSHAQATDAMPNQLAVATSFLIAAHGGTQNTTPSANQQPNPKHPAQAPAGPVPPELAPGVASLVSAKASLEKAGDKWGGHRVKAIALIDKALKACGKTGTHTAGEMKSSTTDDAAALQTGTTELTNAQTVFKNAKNKWGGRTAQVATLIDQALTELQAAGNATKKRK